MLPIERVQKLYGPSVHATVGGIVISFDLVKLSSLMITIRDALVAQAEVSDDQGLETLSVIELRAALREYLADLDVQGELFRSADDIMTIQRTEGKNGMIHTIPTVVPLPTIWPRPDVMAGIVLLLGSTDSGKTHHALQTLDPDLAIRIGEPSENRWDDFERRIVLSPSSIGQAFVLTLAFSACGLSVSLDSLRLLMRELPGAASKGGISASFETALTALNNMCAIIGVSPVCVMNPLDADEATMDTYFKNIASSLTGVIRMADRKVAEETFRLAETRVTGSDDRSSRGSPDDSVPYGADVCRPRNLDTKTGPRYISEPRIPLRASRDAAYDYDAMLAATGDDVHDQLTAEIQHNLLSQLKGDK